MEITRIKIQDELMTALTAMFLATSDVNDMLKTTVKSEIQVSEKDIAKYFEAHNAHHVNVGSSAPYISLISDNAFNEMQVYINQAQVSDAPEKYVITGNDLECRSRHCAYQDQNKYYFYNP